VSAVEQIEREELQSIETICEIGDAAVQVLECSLGEETADIYPGCAPPRARDVEAGVRFILDNPAAPLAAQHDAWIARNRARLGTDDPRLVPFEQLPFGQQLKARLWRHIVHAIIG
jgi:hypothetical protein